MAIDARGRHRYKKYEVLIKVIAVLIYALLWPMCIIYDLYLSIKE